MILGRGHQVGRPERRDCSSREGLGGATPVESRKVSETAQKSSETDILDAEQSLCQIEPLLILRQHKTLNEERRSRKARRPRALHLT
jgi:hypothetical protein